MASGAREFDSEVRHYCPGNICPSILLEPSKNLMMPCLAQEYAEKNRKMMARRGQLMASSLSRAEVNALMKRTRSVSLCC